jgi:hypothetical protein
LLYTEEGSSDDDGLKAIGLVIQIDEARIRIMSARWSGERSKKPSTHCWMRKGIGFPVQGVTNEAKAGRIVAIFFWYDEEMIGRLL